MHSPIICILCDLPHAAFAVIPSVETCSLKTSGEREGRASGRGGEGAGEREGEKLYF